MPGRPAPDVWIMQLQAEISVIVDEVGSVETKPGPLVTTVSLSTKPVAIVVDPSTQFTAVPVVEHVVACALAVAGKAASASAPQMPTDALLSSRPRTVAFFIFEDPLIFEHWTRSA